MASNVADEESSTFITTDILNGVLKEFKTILKVEIKFPKTHGMMSDVRKVFLQYDQTTGGISPKSIIVKRSKVAKSNFLNANGSDIMRHGELYKREVMLNRMLQGKQYMPVLYHSDMNEEQDMLLIMEDCTDENEVKEGSNVVLTAVTTEKVGLNAEGATAASVIEITVDYYLGGETFQSVTLDSSKMSIIIRDIASLHAEFYHENDKSRLIKTRGILCGNEDEFFKEKNLQCLPEFFQFMHWTMKFKEFSSCESKQDFSCYNDESVQSIGQNIADVWSDSFDFLVEFDYEDFSKYDISRKLKEMQNNTESVKERWCNAFKVLTEESALTLVHGDFRADNLTIRNNTMKLFDWQCVSLGCGLFDVSSILYSSLDVDQLFETEEDYLKLYFETLLANGCDIFTYEEMKNWYACALWYDFKNFLTFAGFIKSSSPDTTIGDVKFESLRKSFVSKAVSVINGLYRHCYQK